MEVHVNDYKKCIEYNQPELHICYKGQKRDILAEAIKHLVFQAGTYDCFINIFGGSGAATLAVLRRNNAVYVFNDLDFGIYCLFDTIADDEEYKQLIQYVKYLQNDLDGKDRYELFDRIYEEGVREKKNENYMEGTEIPPKDARTIEIIVNAVDKM